MKGIKIPSSRKSEFLQAAKKLGLTVKTQRKASTSLYIIYRVEGENVSQNDLFQLGLYFALFAIEP